MFIVSIALTPLISIEDAIYQTLLKVALIVALPALAILAWFVGTQGYLRSGKGVKFGIIDNVNSADMKNWGYARETLSQLFKSNRIRERVALRLVPPSKVIDETSRVEFSNRYHFDLLMHAHSEGKTLNLRILTREALDDDWTRATLTHIQALCSARQNKPWRELIPHASRNIYDAIIFIAASTFFTRRDFDNASVLLDELEEQLQHEFSVKDRPRAQVRWLKKMCLVAPGSFDISKGLPEKNDFDYALQKADESLEYGEEDPGVYLAAARLQFLAGDLERAEQLCAEAERYELTGSTLRNQCLDRAFLSCLKGQWDTSYEHYRKLFEEHNYTALHWSDLVAFVDLARELGYDHTEFLCVLYRRAAGMTVPNQLDEAAKQWVNADTSRSQLGALLQRSFRQPSKQRAKNKGRTKGGRGKGRKRQRKNRSR